jgi:hypothetical protein
LVIKINGINGILYDKNRYFFQIKIDAKYIMGMSGNLLQIITQGSPVIFILLFLFFPLEFVVISEHSLGKFVAVLLISLYTYQDMTHGFIACMLFILYYQQDLLKKTRESFLSQSSQNYYDFIPSPSLKQSSPGFSEIVESDYIPVTKAYPESMRPLQTEKEATFRKEKCNMENVVAYKDLVVKHPMVTYVYPELQFHDIPCNPCDSTCYFSITDQKVLE